MTIKPEFVVVGSHSELTKLSVVRPRHTHDCDCCKFLGYADQPGHVEYALCDVYLCGEEDPDSAGTLIIRYDSQGPDYLSLPALLAAQCTSAAMSAATALRRSYEEQGRRPEWVGLAVRAA